MSSYVIGIDFGSDSVRSLIVDASNGKEMASAVVEYPRWKRGEYCNGAIFQYRQHPLDYVESLEQCVRQALSQTGEEVAANVVGISFDTTASTPVLTDMDGTPLALLPEYKDNPDAMFVLWKDHTAMAESDRINEVAHSGDYPDYTKYCGGTYSPEWVWSKMLHCLKHSPELQGRAYSWVEHGDWIAGILAGRTEPRTMARSRCLAGHKAMWHEDWGGLPSSDFLRAVDPLLGIFDGHLFSETLTFDKRAGGLCPEWAERLGLQEGISIGVGGVDCHVGAVGAGITPGMLVKVMGTSTCDITVGTYEAIDGKAVRGICGQVDGSVLPGFIGLEAGQSAFGDVYAWLKRFTGCDLNDLAAQALELSLSENDMVALDWFNGRRTPDVDHRKKGAIFGLTLSSTPAQVYKALVEATAYGSRAINERFADEGVPVDSIVAVGGVSRKSPYVMQTMADVIGVPISVLDSDQACALGAAMFAACGAGLYDDVTEAQKAMKPGICAEYAPDAERHQIYDVLYERYKRIGQI